MFNVYPYTPASAVIEQIRPDREQSQFMRKNHADHWKVQPKMNSHLHALEEHVRSVNSRRLEEALKAEQIRLASKYQVRGMNRIISNIRSGLGLFLIDAGKRIAAKPATGAA